MTFQAEWLHLHQEITSQGPWVKASSAWHPTVQALSLLPPLQTGTLRVRHEWLCSWQVPTLGA